MEDNACLIHHPQPLVGPSGAQVAVIVCTSAVVVVVVGVVVAVCRVSCCRCRVSLRSVSLLAFTPARKTSKVRETPCGCSRREPVLFPRQPSSIHDPTAQVQQNAEAENNGSQAEECRLSLHTCTHPPASMSIEQSGHPSLYNGTILLRLTSINSPANRIMLGKDYLFRRALVYCACGIVHYYCICSIQLDHSGSSARHCQQLPVATLRS